MQDEFLFEVHEGDKCHFDKCQYMDRELLLEGVPKDCMVCRSPIDGVIHKFHTSCWELWKEDKQE